MIFLHRLGEGGEQLGLEDRIVGEKQPLGGRLQRHLRHRQQHGEFGPGQATIVRHPTKQRLSRLKSLDPAIEPTRCLEHFGGPHEAGEAGYPARLGGRQGKALQPVVLEDQFGDIAGHPHKQLVALVLGQPPFAHFAVERDLDVDLIIRAVDPGTIVDEVGVDPPAVCGKFDPRGLGDGEVGAFADDLGADVGGVDPERIIGRVADRAMGLGRGLDVSADAAEPHQVDRRFQDRVDQRGRVGLAIGQAEHGGGLFGQVDGFE
jgi:hypothetical protein